jgi:hypothetical protein
MSHWPARLRVLDSAADLASEISETSETPVRPPRGSVFGDSGDFGTGVEIETELLGRGRAGCAGEAAVGDRLAHLIVEATACPPEPCAWRLYSRRLDRELWVTRDAQAAAQLDRDGARVGLPVVVAADLEQLRSFDDRSLNDLLDVLTFFPGARLAQLEPEAAS